MGTVRDRWRSHLLQTLSGTDDGSPPWVLELATGTDAGFFGPGSASWAVHGGMATMVAGIRALLVQALHPGAMAGVHDWSRYRDDPLGRLTGTIRWLITVTFGDQATAERSSAMVRALHQRVTGEYVDAFGVTRSYAASDPELIEWVHLAFTDSFLTCHEIWEPEIPGGPDAYVREWATAGALVGLSDPPVTAADLRGRLAAVAERGILTADARVLDVVRFIRNPPLARGMIPAYRIMFAGAVGSLDPVHRRMLGLARPSPLAVPATGVVLRSAKSLLGERSTSEEAALHRIARLQREAA
ncbi:oxygenase MpaB family protein [uncultured Microbacterium sp.]|uniref:oxygenase MpaB family protein n=1 Tax=uncultured Microbacterium sp. TaxID=191216 RepID=UPI0028D70A82|nr:oxygenase MpaB family protein [uncultured Microbacterium sp.]